jgi:hypothetical protein
MRYLLLILLFLSCNPVKQVLNNKEKLAQVAEVVVRNGWCANDTTFITKSDTLVEIDTIIDLDIRIDTQKVNEFVYVTKWKTNTITKTLTIHDTIKSFIVDNARVRLLQADSARLSNEVIEWKGKAKRRQIWLFFIIAVIAGSLYIKSKL